MKLKDASYFLWFSENWLLAGGLITQSKAARLLGVSPTRVRQSINEGKITPYVFLDNNPLVSLSEILNIREGKK